MPQLHGAGTLGSGQKQSLEPGVRKIKRQAAGPLWLRPRTFSHLRDGYCICASRAQVLESPWWSSDKESTWQCKGCGLHPWSTKIPQDLVQWSPMCQNYWSQCAYSLLCKRECVCAQLLQSCPTLCDPMEHSLPGSSVHGLLQARTLEWVAMPSSRGSSQLRGGTHIFCGSCIAGRFSLPLSHQGSPSSMKPLQYEAPHTTTRE